MMRREVNNMPVPQEQIVLSRCNIQFPEMVLYSPLNFSVTEDGLTAESSLKIKIFSVAPHLIISRCVHPLVKLAA